METKKRDDERRRESGIYYEDGEKKWVSLKGRQPLPTSKIRPRYVIIEDVDRDTESELERAVDGRSQRLDRYQAARIIAAKAIEQGILTAREDGE